MKPVHLHFPKFDRLATYLNSRTMREKQLIIGFLLVLVFFADYFILLAPLIRVFSESSPRIGPLKIELKELQEDARNKDLIQKKWEEMKKTSEERDQAFIAPDGTPALLENLSKEAQGAGVKITSLVPTEAAKGSAKGSYSPLLIEMRALAGAHEFGRFISNLESGKTFFKVKSLKISAAAQNERRHQILLTLEAYRREK